MTRKYKATFDVYIDETEASTFENQLEDLLQTSVLPALSAELVPLTIYVSKKRVS